MLNLIKTEAATRGVQPEDCSFIKKETLAQVFPREFCEIFKNTFFTEQLWTTASGKTKLKSSSNLLVLSWNGMKKLSQALFVRSGLSTKGLISTTSKDLFISWKTTYIILQDIALLFQGSLKKNDISTGTSHFSKKNNIMIRQMHTLNNLHTWHFYFLLKSSCHEKNYSNNNVTLTSVKLNGSFQLHRKSQISWQAFISCSVLRNAVKHCAR